MFSFFQVLFKIETPLFQKNKCESTVEKLDLVDVFYI